MVVAFAIVVVLSTAAFISTEQAYIARLNADNVDGSVTETRLAGSGDDLHVELELRIENPTRHHLTIWSVVLDVRLADTVITRRSPDTSEWEVAADSTERITIELPVLPDERQYASENFDAENVRVDGYVWLRIVNSEAVIEIGSPDPRAEDTPTPPNQPNDRRLPLAPIGGAG